jgi:hypothetical protein
VHENDVENPGMTTEQVSSETEVRGLARLSIKRCLHPSLLIASCANDSENMPTTCFCSCKRR